MRKRDLCIIFIAITAAVCLTVGILSAETIETGNWGLSFSQEGAPPSGPASAAALKEYDAVYLGNTDEK